MFLHGLSRSKNVENKASESMHAKIHKYLKLGDSLSLEVKYKFL